MDAEIRRTPSSPRSRTRRRVVVSVLLGGLALPTLGSAAAAASGSVVTVTPTLVLVAAGPGANNNVVVYDAGAEIGIIDGAGIVRAPGCRAVTNAVLCPTRPRIQIKTGDGNDSVLALTSIPVTVKGGTGDDTVTGGNGSDKIVGQGGNDTLRGGAGDDELLGSAGDDTLEGGAGADKLIGQSGADLTEYRDPRVWPTMTPNTGADDGEPGEHDNIRTERARVVSFNYRADDAVLPAGTGALRVADTFVGGGNFDLETQRETGMQAVGYYDADGMMRVAARRIGESTWVHTPPLATKYPKDWDGHRYIEVAFDPDGRLHMAGNAHGWEIDPTEEIVVCCSPLQYFRTAEPVDDPADVLTLARAGMLSPDPLNPVVVEQLVTYPQFFSDGTRFFFAYRDGWSNYAEMYVNQLNRTTGQWFNPNGGEPWFTGWQGFLQGDPDDGLVHPHTTGTYTSMEWDGEQFHLWSADAWVYDEDCPAGEGAVDSRCTRNYVRTPDFDHFYDATGAEIATPIDPDTRTDAMVVDRARLGGAWGSDSALDEQGNPMTLYGKFVDGRPLSPGNREGLYQVFFARWDGMQWQRVQISAWEQWNERVLGLPTVFSIRSVNDAQGVLRWYVKATIFDPPQTRTTGWHEIDLDTLVATPMPATFAPPAESPCATGSTATRPAPPPDPVWTHPATGIGLVSHVVRSNVRQDGLGEEASDYYYLSYNTIGGYPTSPQSLDHPPVELTVRRTTCTR